MEMDAANDSLSEYSVNHDEGNEESDEKLFCTSAVTGTNPTFQAIFLCNESPAVGNNLDGPAIVANGKDAENQSQLCVCQACAEACFDEDYHDVEYIGMGPSYCDCYRMGNCKIFEESLREAQRLGISPSHLCGENQQEVASSTESSSTDFIREAFDISILQRAADNETKSNLATLLVDQARELIRHTKETHWIDERVVGDGDKKILCLMESLAWSIYRSHRDRYKYKVFPADGDNERDIQGGAEWWVQVKDISSSNSPMRDFNVDENDTTDVENKGGPISSLPSSSIDLHYDKDEALAESFGIGSFPALSTVTYLTEASTTAAPTIVFDHTYTQGEDEVMSSMMVSRPRIGKHICFDGRLLHGAPYHPSLLPSMPANPDGHGPIDPATNNNHDDSQETIRKPLFRVTFLVNVWKNRKPANVKVLSDQIRHSINSLTQPEKISVEESRLLLTDFGSELPMTPLEIPKVNYEEEQNLPETSKDRIELPFVSNLSEEDDVEGGGTVVVTFPPPPTNDSVMITFGPGLQAYIDYSYGSEEEDGDSQSNAAQADDESSHSPIPDTHSDYV